MDNIAEKFKAALDVFRTMLAKEGLREGVKVADDLLKELTEHKVSVLPAQEAELWLNDLKELDVCFEDLFRTEGIKDAGHRWIEFSDKWQAFKKRWTTLSLKREQPEADSELERMGLLLMEKDGQIESLQIDIAEPDKAALLLKAQQENAKLKEALFEMKKRFGKWGLSTLHDAAMLTAENLLKQ